MIELTDLIEIPSKKMSTAEFRYWIEEQEALISEAAEEYFDRHSCLTQEGYKLEQAITPGIYTRELTMPAGSLIFSRIHLETHPFLVTKGKVSVYDGVDIVTIEAPYKGVTLAGTKRLLYIHEDTTWITFHPVDSDDIEEMDKDGVITCTTFDQFDLIKGDICHSLQ